LSTFTRSLTIALCLITLLALTAGCAVFQPHTTQRDKTAKGAAIGAGSGAVAALIAGERELDEVLAGAAVGAAVGAGVGAYLDYQEEKLARIPGTTVERLGDNMLLVRFDSDVLFDIDSAILTSQARTALDDAADVFVEYRKTAIITQGHTDATGSETHNQALSERRATSVMNHLIARTIAADRITAAGYGEGYPVADNTTTSGRAANRRVDLLLKAKVR
jgi:outer membrane protein OmpA-like peptidoglycan-associated protein